MPIEIPQLYTRGIFQLIWQRVRGVTSRSGRE